MPKEPQSYGSEKDWVTGRVGQEVNDQKSGGAGENVRDKEYSAPHQGGHVSAEQAREQAGAPEACDVFDDGQEGAKKVTAVEGGAQRDSFFKRRDYNS
ncbi:MAG TPA: hypothetical protein VLU46_14520 [Thermoanaerobaculia bacterium]|nr:hypothetical protein [Thermoanaerobaculia bacterium]